MNLKQEYRILHVEDLPSDALLAEHTISKVFDKFTIRVVETEAEFISALETFDPHIVISDFSLPSFDGMSVIKIVLEKSPQTPVIILTGSMNEDTAVDCIKAGAVDYVIKEHIKRLGPAILQALEQKIVKQEQKKALNQIKLLSKAIEKSPMGIVITGPEAIIEYSNPKYHELTGYSSDEMQGENMRLFSSGRQPREFYEEMWQTILKGDDWTGELLNKKKSGELYWENMAISSITDDAGGISHFIAIKQDITENKQIHSDLVEAKEKAEESDKLKTAFLRNISHEIRTPLNAIVGFSALLGEPDIDDKTRNFYIDTITNSSNQFLDIISDIIDVSNIEAKIVKVSRCEVMLNSVVALLNDQFTSKVKEKSIRFYPEPGLPDEEPTIYTDKAKLIRVFSHLLNNAIKYTKEGEIRFGYIRKGERIEFFVSDTGMGIAKENQEKVFNRFFQIENPYTKLYEGTGLGLSICKAYVELLGGEIELKSVPGSGSTFSFSLPNDEPDNIKERLAGEKGGTGHTNTEKKRILIVEDIASNLELITIYLAGINAELVYATNGQEAVDEALSDKKIDLILMDIRMPVMDGFAATKIIKAVRPDIPIIAQTAYTDEAEIATENKFCGVIIKPFSKSQLLEVAGKYI